MKLRQKLAAVLAATMVVTAVPVVTFAASTNRPTNVVKVAEGTKLEEGVAPELVVDLKDGITTNEAFYIKLENATFTKTGSTYDINGVYGDFKVETKDGKELKVELANKSADVVPGTEITARIPMITTIKSGEAKAIIEENRVVTGGEYKFATTQEGSVTVTTGDTPSFYEEGGEIASITLNEDTIGALVASSDEDETTVEITVALDSKDFEFVAPVKGDTIQPNVELTRGFKSKNIEVAYGSDDKVASTSPIKFDKDEVTITLNKSDLTSGSVGRVVITGLVVDTDERNPETGDLTVEVINDAVAKDSHKVATVAEYGVSLALPKDKKATEVIAGNKAKVEFELSEKVAATISNGRELEFNLEQGFFVAGSIKIDQEDTSNDPTATPITDDDGNITGFKFKVENASDATKETFKVKAEVILPMEKEGDIIVKAEGRAISETVELVIAKATPAVKIEATGFKADAGIKEQKGGKVVITETDKGTLQKGENLEFVLPVQDGLTFTDKPEVTVTSGDLKVDKDNIKLVDEYKIKMSAADAKAAGLIDALPSDGAVNVYVTVSESTLSTVEKKYDVKSKELTGTKVVVPVSRASREASTIEVEGFKVKLDRSVPTGKYDLTVKGAAIGTKGSLKQKEFFTVGIENEDAGNKVTTTITNGATEMVVNGEKVTLEAPAFLEKGKMMVPLRAVAEAFGINSKDIVYSAGNIAIFANGRTISLTIGSTKAVVNGAEMTLANPAKIVNERTTVPVGDLGRLLGLNVEWDNATKTATFTNK